MPEHTTKTTTGRDEMLVEALHLLKESHTRDYHQPDHLRSTAYLTSRLNERIQRLLEDSIALHKLNRGWLPGGEPPDEAAHDIEAMTRENVMHILWNHVYSTPGHYIKSQRFGQLLLEQHLERCAMEHASSPENLRHMGLVTFDMNETRQIRKYIGHVNTGLCLQGISRVLTEIHSPTRHWLENDCGLSVTPTAIGGDEFAITLQGDMPLRNDFLTSVGERYQQEIAQDKELLTIVDLTSPSLRAEFGETLPDECPITVACGAATPDEGILWARMRDDNDQRFRQNGEKDGFKEQCAKIYAGTLHIADTRLQKYKSAFKERLERVNPGLARFLTGSREDRDLMDRLKTGKTLVTDTLTTVKKLLDQLSQRLEQGTEEGDEIAQE